MTKPIPMVEGSEFYLRPVERTDYEHAMGPWLQDREVTRYLSRGIVPQNAEQRVQQFNAQQQSTTDVEFAIVSKHENQTIGVAGLHTIQWIARHAELRILIGDKLAWGRNIGTEASQLLVAYGIQLLNLQKIWLGVNAENKRALNAYTKIGFQQEGVLRRELFRNDRYYDIIRMSILAEEYSRLVNTWPTQSLIEKQLQHHD